MFKIQNSIQQVYRFYTYRNVGFEHRNDIGCVLLQCIGLSWVPLGELGGGYLPDRWNIGISGLSFASLHHLTTISTSSHNHLHYHHGILFTASILTKLGLFFFLKKSDRLSQYLYRIFPLPESVWDNDCIMMLLMMSIIWLPSSSFSGSLRKRGGWCQAAT